MQREQSPRIALLKPIARVLSVMLFTLAAPFTAALAQANLDSAVTTAPVINDAHVAQITQYIGEHVPGLSSSTPETVMRARKELLRPLSQSASVPFRLKYSELLAPTLREILSANPGNEKQQVNALVIAGELGTSRSLDLMRLGRASTLASVRYQAATAARRTVETFGAAAINNQAAMNPDEVTRLIQDGQVAMQKEEDALIIAAHVHACSAGLRYASIQSRSAQILGDAVNALAKRWNTRPMPPAVLQSIEVALSEARDQIQSNTRVGQPFLNSACDCAGSFLWHAKMVVEARSLSEGAGEAAAAGREAYAPVAASCGTLLELCGGVSQPKVTFPSRKFADMLRAATQKSDADFVLGVNGYLDLLTKPPFSLDRSRFTK